MQHFWLGTGLLMAALGRAKNIGQRALTWMYQYMYIVVAPPSHLDVSIYRNFH